MVPDNKNSIKVLQSTHQIPQMPICKISYEIKYANVFFLHATFLAKIWVNIVVHVSVKGGKRTVEIFLTSIFPSVSHW